MYRNNTRENIIEQRRNTIDAHSGASVSVAKNHVNRRIPAPYNARKMEYVRNDLNKGCSNNRWNIKSHFSSRVASIGTWFGDVLGDYTTCSNHDIIADADRHDGGIRADAHPISDGGFFPLGLITASRAANSEWVVDEHSTMADEAVFTDSH